MHPRGIAAIESATQAAEALKPLAGDFASVVFATGIIGTGLLAVPILAGSSAYAVAETFRLREGLYLKLRQAPGFYGIILLSTLIGFAMDLVGINPIQGLYYAAILNGIVSPPMLIIITQQVEKYSLQVLPQSRFHWVKKRSDILAGIHRW